MVEAREEDQDFNNNDENDDGEGWDDAEGWSDDEEEDPQEAARKLMQEVEEERKQAAAVAENMAQIEQMQKDWESKMSSGEAKVTGWSLITVKRFVQLMKQELAEE